LTKQHRDSNNVVEFVNYDTKVEAPITLSYEQFKSFFPYRALFKFSDSASGSGFIKEPTFSCCGDFICSPYHRGVRMFDFKEGLELLQHRKNEKELLQLPLLCPLISTHSAPVLTCRYHPFLPMLASGGLDAKINFYMPQC